MTDLGVARGDDPGIYVFDAVLLRAIRDRPLPLRHNRACAHHSGNSDLGIGSVGLLSGTAITADAGRRTEDRSDRTVAQCIVYVPGIFAWCDARIVVPIHAAVTTLGLVGAVCEIGAVEFVLPRCPRAAEIQLCVDQRPPALPRSFRTLKELFCVTLGVFSEMFAVDRPVDAPFPERFCAAT